MRNNSCVSNAGARVDHENEDHLAANEPPTATAAPRRCGRPTRSGAPCRNVLQPNDVACPSHRTAEDVAVAALLREAWHDGYQLGARSARIEYRERVVHVPLRVRTLDGLQIVQVNGYAYTWHDDEHPLEVGDRVVIPGSWWHRSPSEGIVGSLGTSYEGPLVAILRRLEAES